MLMISPTRVEATFELPAGDVRIADSAAFPAVLAQFDSAQAGHAVAPYALGTQGNQLVPSPDVVVDEPGDDASEDVPQQHADAQEESLVAQSVPDDAPPLGMNDDDADEEEPDDAGQSDDLLAGVERSADAQGTVGAPRSGMASVAHARPGHETAQNTERGGQASTVRMAHMPGHEAIHRVDARTDRDGPPPSPQPFQRSAMPQIEVRQDAGPPAAMRAVQVEAGIRLENATGQPSIPQPGAAIAPPISTGATTASIGETGGVNAQPTPIAALSEVHGSASGRILRGLVTLLNTRGGTMTMRLEPPELGQLRVQMTIARGVVSAQFFPANHQAQQLLEQNLAALRTALEHRGLSVERLVVQPGAVSQSPPQSAGQASHGTQDGSGERASHEQRHDASGGESRGRGERRSHGVRSGSEQFAEAMAEVEVGA